MDRSLCSVGHEGITQRKAARAHHCGRSVAVAVLLAALCAAPASAALYKWTDANGRVVYSDQPPPGNVKVDTIAGPPPPANPNAVKEMANKEAEGRKQQADAADNAKKAAQTRADDQKRLAVCRDARNEIAALSADQLVFNRLNEKGEPVYMDDNDRRKRRETLDVMVRTNNCPAS